MTSLQRALSAEGATLLTSYVEIGALPDLVRLLEHTHDALVLQAACCLTNLASDPNPTLALALTLTLTLALTLTLTPTRLPVRD